MQGKQSWLILLVNLIINTRTAQPDGFPPQFDGVQKLQYRAVVGQVVRLRCIVKGEPPPTITWTKNEKPLQLSNRIKTSNNRTVRIKGAIPSDRGNYSCFVENRFGKINMTMQLTVRDVLTTSRTLLSTTPVLARDLQGPSFATSTSSLGAPRFAEPEKLKRAFIAWPASHTIRLKCKAIGAPPLKYTWLKDGKRVTSRRLDPYINTTIWFLRLKELVPTDSGKYTCNVSNPYGSINHTYTVEVVAKPRSKPILHSNLPKNTSVQLGGNATMKCIVLLSGTLPDFRWLKWDKVTTANPKIKEDGTDNGTSYQLIDPIHYSTIKVGEHYGVQLMIVNVTEEDLGLYTCYVSNHIGTDYRSALLSRIEKSTVPPSNGNGFINNGEGSMGEKTPTRMSAPAENLPQKKSNPAGQIALILLLVFVLLVVIGVVLFVFCYRKRFQDKLSGDTKPPVTEIRLQEVDSVPPTSTLIPQEGESPSQTDRTVRMFTYPVPRGRKSSTGSINSTTSLIKYRHGSHRSRLSSGVSSRLDSNITEEEYPELPCDEEWEIDRSQITLREQLGEGAFGLVMRADALALPNMPAKCSVAVKMLKADATENELADLLSEMDTMKEIGSHKNIINLIGACTQSGPLFVVVEFAPFGNLRQFLRERRPPSSDYQRSRPNSCGPSLTMRDFVSYAFQIARGMEYLGTRRCVHRDLAARNILVGEDYVMKIADFGLARNIRDMEYYRKTTDGRLPIKWLAIEALFDRVYTTQSDVWAFGILLWEIFTLGGSPYPGIPVEKLFDLLKSGYRMQKPQNCPSDIYDIMLNCWDENPNNRASFTQLKMKFDAMLSSMTNKEYLEILAQSIEDIAQEMETPITDDSDVNNEVEAITESSC